MRAWAWGLVSKPPTNIPGISISSAKIARPLAIFTASTFTSGLLTTWVSGGATVTGTVRVRVCVSMPPPGKASSSWKPPPSAVGHSPPSMALISGISRSDNSSPRIWAAARSTACTGFT